VTQSPTPDLDTSWFVNLVVVAAVVSLATWHFFGLPTFLLINVACVVCMCLGLVPTALAHAALAAVKRLIRAGRPLRFCAYVKRKALSALSFLTSRVLFRWNLLPVAGSVRTAVADWRLRPILAAEQLNEPCGSLRGLTKRDLPPPYSLSF
jgi:hypothetical protein